MKTTTIIFLAIIGSALLAPHARADEPKTKLQCDSTRWVIDGLETYCEVREITAPFAGSLDVDAGPLGGALVTGWDNPDVLIRALVQTAAPDDSQASALASQVQVIADAGSVRSTGPAPAPDSQWYVSYEIFMPRNAGLSVNAKTGGIEITGMNGGIRFLAATGGVVLDSLAGDVQGQTSTGGIKIVLAGDRWDGQGMDVQAKVGGIQLELPAGYSAHLDVSTALGSIRSAVPLTVVKNGLAHSASGDIGAGGALIRAATRVGGITIVAK